MIGRRIYFDPATGDVLQVTEERAGVVTQTTVEEDLRNYQSLAGWTKSSVGVLELEFGEYHEEFELGRILAVQNGQPVFNIDPMLADPTVRQQILQAKERF